MAASEAFLQSSEFDTSHFAEMLILDNDTQNHIVRTAESFRQRIQTSDHFEKLSAPKCLALYATQYVSLRGDVLLVQNQTGIEFYQNNAPYPSGNYTSEDNGNTGTYRQPATYIQSPNITVIPYNEVKYGNRSYEDYAGRNGLPYVSSPTRYPSYDWQCPLNSSTPCQPNNRTVIPDQNDWRPFGDTVQYCWSEKMTESCKLSFNIYFAITVMACNLCKAIGMFLTYRTHKQWALITLGDAIESFLDRPDDSTFGLSICSTDRIQRLWGWGNGPYGFPAALTSPQDKSLLDVAAKRWIPRSRYWAAAANRRRWAGCFIP